MPIGERIGQAYVRVILDGDDADFRKEMASHGGKWDAVGKQQSDHYWDGYNKQSKKRSKNQFKETVRDFEKGFGRWTAIGEQSANLFSKGFSKRMDKALKDRGLGKDIGNIIREGLTEKFRLTGDFGAVKRDLENFNVLVEKAVKKRAALETKAARDTERAETAHFRSTIQEYKNLQKLVERLTAGEIVHGRSIKETSVIVANLGDEFKRLDANRFDEKFGHGAFHETAENLKIMRRELQVADPGLTRFNNKLDATAVVLGKTFGRGSRNNFVNFFGVMTERFARLTFLLPKAVGGISRFGKLFKAGFADAAAEGAGLFGRLGAGFASAGLTGGKLVTSLGAVAAGLGALFILIGPIVSAVGLLTAAIISMASSITFALSAAIAPLVGILTPLALGLGFAAVIFGTMTVEAHKAFIQGLQPLHDIFVDMAKVAQGKILGPFPAQIKTLGANLKEAGLVHLFETAGQSISDFIGKVAEGTGGNVFGKFVESLDAFLPVLSDKLGNVTLNLSGALAGVFRAAIPATTEYLGWLDKITGKFSAWANSVKGQNALKKFFDDASESAKAVGGFIKEVGGAIKDLFVAGKDDGDDLFTRMKDKAIEFREYLKANPDALKKWFEDGKKFASELGNAVMSAGNLIEKLDTASSRKGVILFFESLATVLDAIATSMEAIDKASGWIGKGVRKVANLNPENPSNVADLADATGHTMTKKDNLGVSQWARDMKVLLQDTGSVDAALKRLSETAHSVPPTVPVKVTDNGTADQTSNDAKRTKGFMDVLVGSYVSTITDKGSGNKVSTIAKGVKILLDPIAGTFTAVLNAEDNISPLMQTVLDNYNNLKVGLSGEKDGGIKLGADFKVPVKKAMGDVVGSLASGRLFPKGGFANFRQIYEVGESGREAIVPLDRPLGQIDASVRMLAAVAQGRATVGGPSSVMNNNVTVVSNSQDPATVAQEWLNKMAGAIL